ncbi:MAG: DUF711 family protein, partial [Desulfobacterales bacterium]|nr:DUF711 family protein [Desulfobacterales bacterium]
VQTRRVCFAGSNVAAADAWTDDASIYLSAGSLDGKNARAQLDRFLSAGNVAFNLDGTRGVEPGDVDVLFEIIQKAPAKTFSFAYTFNNPPSSPFFPSAAFQREGFAIGLQATNLAVGCDGLDEWLNRMKWVWTDLMEHLGDDPGFLGIDSSVAPLFEGGSSLVNFIRRLHGAFTSAVTTDVFLKITRFIKSRNPRPAGLCGLMFPCLEDFELAEEYEAGNFTMERNIFLALHSGLGVDTYPIGVDESRDRVLEILNLLRGLSAKYDKPLSARFISDGKAGIGQKTAFGNPYLKDVVIRRL